jgi:hypothetical protein
MIFHPSPESNPPYLVVEIHENETFKALEGALAWEWLLHHHPSLRDISWLAQKLGISRTIAQGAMRGADVVRKLCFRCR